MFRLLKYDFKRGTMQYFKGYLCAFVICLCSSIYLKNIIADMNAAGVLASHGTIMDYYMYAVKGMETYVLKKDSLVLLSCCACLYHWQLYAKRFCRICKEYNSCNKNPDGMVGRKVSMVYRECDPLLYNRIRGSCCLGGYLRCTGFITGNERTYEKFW